MHHKWQPRLSTEADARPAPTPRGTLASKVPAEVLQALARTGKLPDVIEVVAAARL